MCWGLMFQICSLKKKQVNSFITLKNETINDTEKEGVDGLFKMMIALRQQVILRRKYENIKSQTVETFKAK